MMRPVGTFTLLATLLGCAGLGDRGATGSPGAGDASPDPAADAGAGFDSAEGLPASPETPGYREGDDLGPDTGTGATDPACFLADAEPAPYECDGALLARCPGLRSCCVGDGDCCSAVSDGALPDGMVPFADCGDGDALDCLTGNGVSALAFGDPRPRVQDGALLPNGDDAYDSGLVLGDAVDLTAHRVRIDATFASPADCGASCLEGVGVGLSTQEAFGDDTHVRMRVGLLYSGARGDVSLIVGDEVARSWDLSGTEEQWSLIVRPTGELDVLREGTGVPVHVAHLAPAPRARLVVHGRNHNRPADSPLGARLTGLTVTTELCDIPSAWPERAMLSLREPGTAAWGPSFAHAPTVARNAAGETLFALEHDGNLIVAQPQEGGDPTELVLLGSPDSSVVEAPEGTSLADPELHWDARIGRWVLYYTIDSADGASIGRAIEDGEIFEPDAEPLLKAGDEGWLRIEQPTVQDHHSGQRVLIARVTDGEGGQQLAAYLSTDGARFSPYGEGHLGPITRRGDVSASGFDADEIAHPSLIVHDGAWQLHYAGRRGTRWGVGLLVSDELLRWRWISDDGAILAGDGNGFDRVGAGAPDAISVGQTVELYYEGSDGTRIRLGRAVRQATSFGTR